MRVYKPLEQINQLSNGIFLAGPSPRMDKIYEYDCQWRQYVIQRFRELGYKGDLIDPINRKFDQTNLVEQVKWQRDAMMKSSLVFFWIPRSEQHPGFTTNVQFGTWLTNKSILLGCPKDSIKNDYLKIRFQLDNTGTVFNDLDKMIEYAFNIMQKRKSQVFFTSDTHFTQERTLKLSRRPFRNIQDMDLTLISNWNKKITMNDIVYHLGDFGNQEIVSLLNFKKMYFIPGNYEEKDGIKILRKDERVEILTPEVNIFDNSVQLPKFNDIETGQIYNLVHQPLCNYDLFQEDNEEFYLFGHIHRLQIVKRNGINVGCDCYNFNPVSLEEIRFLRGGIENHFDENVFKDYCG